MGKKDDMLLDFAPGAIVDNRYEILSLLGFGAIGRVYLAKHVVLNKTLALKFVHPQKISETSMKRFRLEAKASGLLEHPNIIGIHDYGVTPEGLPYIAMEYFDGKPLADELKENGGLSRIRFFNIFEQVCAGIALAHKNGVLHRDMKPANILIRANADGTDTAKVLDFGMAKLMPGDNHEEARITVTGEVVGSPFYMSPEQCMAKDLDPRTDIYSLGVVMHEVLTGTPIFMGKNPIEVMQKHVHNEPKFSEDAAVLPELQELVLKCLSKDPKKRYQSAEDLAKALSQMKNKEMSASVELANVMEGKVASGSAAAGGFSIQNLSPQFKIGIMVAALLLVAVLGVLMVTLQKHGAGPG